MDYRELVVRVAGSVGLVDAKDELLPLDSMSIFDLVVALEEETSLRIPTADIREEAFKTVDSVVQLLEAVAAAQASGDR